MKLAALAFVVVLVAAHLDGDCDKLLAQPLSTFRDGDLAKVGYLLFALLLTAAGLYVARLWRAGRDVEGTVASFAGGLLVLVAVTPSFDAIHLMYSAFLFVLLFVYYGVLTYQTGTVAFVLHVQVPFVLLAATRLHSYGAWQKGFIVYLVLAATVHEHALRGLVREPSPRPTRSRNVPSVRRRKVYQL